MGAEAGRCTVIEDSAVGVQAGAAAGMTVFGFAAMTDAGALQAVGAVHVFARMDALPELLARAGSVSRAGIAPRPAAAP